MNNTPNNEATLVNNARHNIKEFLRWCNIPYPHIIPNIDLLEACYKDALRRGCSLEEERSVYPFIPGGVAMAATAYAHLEDTPTQIYIAMYTAFLIYLDDVFQHDVAEVSSFNQRFITNQPQGDPVLDAFAYLLLEMPERYGTLLSNMMITSTMKLVTALVLEKETSNMRISPLAGAYPNFARDMSGASDTYALFMFPKDLPVTQFIQSVPDIVTFINNGNDILSFYKEELSEESVNKVSLLAACWKVPKSMVVRYLAAEAACAHDRVLRTLHDYEEACMAYLHFSHGYVGFHVALCRYRLDELGLQLS